MGIANLKSSRLKIEDGSHIFKPAPRKVYTVVPVSTSLRILIGQPAGNCATQ
jgi:hypothetical protein